MSYDALVAALDWQVDLGVDEAIGEEPINRYELDPQGPRLDAWIKKDTPAVTQTTPPADTGRGPVPPVPMIQTGPDPVAVAQGAAAGAASLTALRDALDGYSHCDLRNGAKSLVFAVGNPSARVMIIGEAPGADEDRAGKPFVGRAGQLLDKMLAAIKMDRAAPEPERAVYITNILPWRPPQNRDPDPAEVAMMRPFLERHVELVAPDILVLMGNHACNALMGRKGITRLRGQWTTALGRPALPMFHPAYLLRNPAAKREAWADLLALNAKLRDL
jgi:uracil-DNA glycosylase family 4